MKTILTILFFVSISVSTSAQDKLLLLNGRVDRGKILNDKENSFDFRIYKNGGKEKIIPYDKYRIFSVTDIKGEETILYRRDTAMGNFFTENQMRMYIYGQRDAHNNFGSSHHFVGGFALGITSVLFDTYLTDPSGGFFKDDPSVFPILVPLITPVIVSLFRSNIRQEDVSDVGYLNSEEYIEGFNKVKKFKKIKNTFLGSVAGVAVGMIAYSFGK